MTEAVETGPIETRALWRRIVDFPLMAMVISVILIILGMTVALLLAKYAVPRIPGFTTEMKFDVIALPTVVLLYKLVITRLGRHPRDDLRGTGSLRPLGIGLVA